MGGSGSGRWGSSRRKVEQTLALDIAQLQRHGLFRTAIMRVGWRSGASISIMRLPTGQLRLVYRHRPSDDQVWSTVEEQVLLLATVQRLGGQRQWFACPNCGTRCRILYAGGSLFQCRKCHQLRYASTAETTSGRAVRGMLKIVKLLDPEECCNTLPPRPKGMHWKTYERLIEQYARYQKLWLGEVVRRFRIPA
jgi:hypothetical protein